MARLALVVAALATIAVATACAADRPDDAADTTGQDLSAAKTNDEWFYSGPMPSLDNPHVVASLKGHTTHVTGTLPDGTTLPALPHVKTSQVDGKTQVDVVYPIATAATKATTRGPGSTTSKA